ncbi:MAG: hypothetical protein DMF63_00255 [Acidobacteria bacterium]|nr:MAG: hypothetical protein DMF63_00255 [Acidobacteriota bacterium]
MNDEYLWQKTGVDPEIERLEQKLAVFRYRESTPPVMITETTVASPRRWRIPLAFSFAAALVAVVLISAMLIKRSNTDNDAVVFVENPEFEIASPGPAAIEERKVAPSPNVVPQFAQAKRVKVIRASHVEGRRPKTEDRTPVTVAALSREEKYAYRQLMIALSISSSKLKIVEDTINGNENIERTNSTNQR